MSGADPGAERIVVATLLTSPEARAQHLELIAPEECASDTYASILRAIRTLHRAGDPVDAVSIFLEAKRGGFPVPLDALSDLQTIACAPESLPWYVDQVRSMAQERAARKVAMSMLREDQPVQPSEAARALSDIASRNGPIGWAAYPIKPEDYLTMNIERPASIVGDGLISCGDLGMLYGEGGKGKSFLALQLAYAVATATPWVGMAGPKQPMRVGVVSLELPRHVMQSRIRATCPHPELAGDNLQLISQTEMKARPDLLDPASVRGLVGWIHASRLNLVILDAFSRFWSGDEMKDAAARMAVCDGIRISTGCAILWVHHERKPMSGQTADDDLAALRSSTRYQTDPTVLIRLTESKGLPVLRVAKSNFAAIPDPIYLGRNPDGTFTPVQSPTTAADKTRSRIAAVLRENPTGVSSKSIQEATGYAKNTVAKHLRDLEAENVGTEAFPVYRLPSSPVTLEQEDSQNPW